MMKNNISSSKDIESFIGLSKKEVAPALGEEFNFYPDNEWPYILKRHWWGKSRILHLIFDEEDRE